ncbi:MAG: capsule assembly Wzi family protein, partial [Bacteroidota bacterium]
VSDLQWTLPLGATVGTHPFWLQQTLNTRVPYSENNGAAWYGRGQTFEGMGGVWLSSRFVSLSLQPHLVWQENSDFRSPRFVPQDGNGEVRYVAEGIGTSLDTPLRFGSDPYWTTSWGYSSIRLHAGPMEAGYSTEPLRWGPATRYPLVMSGHAPGFAHAFLGTRSPLHIPWVGSVGFRWVVGYGEESDYYDGPTQGIDRMINGINVWWQPSFWEDLTFGLTRVYHIYEPDGLKWDNVTVLFDPFQKGQLSSELQETGAVGGGVNRNQVASIYARLRLPEARAEIWGEFFREDHSQDLRDIANEPHHNGAWAIGLQKLVDGPWAEFWKVHLELTNLAITLTDAVRSQAYYYTHGSVRHGHTNGGQVLGAAIGPGSTSQYLGLTGYRGDWKVGGFVQRVAENESFHVQRFPIGSIPSDDRFGDFVRHRVNLNIGSELLYGPGPYYLTASLVWSKLDNYGRFDVGDPVIPLTDVPRRDLTNVQFQMGVTYAF